MVKVFQFTAPFCSIHNQVPFLSYGCGIIIDTLSLGSSALWVIVVADRTGPSLKCTSIFCNAGSMNLAGRFNNVIGRMPVVACTDARGSMSMVIYALLLSLKERSMKFPIPICTRYGAETGAVDPSAGICTQLNFV